LTEFLYITGIQIQKTNKKVDRNNSNGSRENPKYDFFINKIQRIDKIVTDPESGEIISSNCGMVYQIKLKI
jgi:hypothetical protein